MEYCAAAKTDALPLGASCAPWGANGVFLRGRRAPNVAKSNY